MRKYEIMVILDPDTDERQVSPLIDKHLKVITKAKGTIDNVDIWGRRHLAYEINKKADGIYAVLNVTADPATVQELDRRFGIDEQVLRTKVLRADK
jgi:small subunit ribosomal protein S6